MARFVVGVRRLLVVELIKILPGTGRGTTKWWRGLSNGTMVEVETPLRQPSRLPPPRAGEDFA
jgi:hypothetical protein